MRGGGELLLRVLTLGASAGALEAKDLASLEVRGRAGKGGQRGQ